MNDRQSRRDALKLLGAAGIAAAAAPLAQAQTAPAAPATPVTTPLQNGNGFYRHSAGDLTITVVSDGAAPLAELLPTWGANPDRQAEFAAALTEYGVAATNTVNHFNPVVVDLGGRRTLIDTGRGATGGQLLANLRRAGILPLTIDTVFITHGHGDHIGGLTTNGRPTFPRARHVMGRAEFEYWAQGQNGQPIGDPVKNNLIALRERFTLIEPGGEIAPGLTSVPTPGHTPHHQSVLIRSGQQQAMVLGDAGGHFLLSLKFPGAYVRFDVDGAQAARTRQEIFARITDEKMWVTGYHFPFPAVGRLRRMNDQGSYEYEPTVWRWS